MFRSFRSVVLVFLWLACACASRAAVEEPAGCVPDRERLLALPEQAFDQNIGHGWREVSERPGCEGAAADLLRDYRQLHPESNRSLLSWHEAQLRAFLGDTPAAIALMEQSRVPAGAPDRIGWNPYVDATTAFLRGDAAALGRAREALAAVPPAPDLPPVKDGYIEMTSPKGQVMRMRWPMNLDVVDGLVRCFGKPYREAYGSAECRPAPPGG